MRVRDPTTEDGSLSLDRLNRDDSKPFTVSENEARVTKVAVAAITFRRIDGLLALLESLEKQRVNPARPYELCVIVVDNDPKMTAQQPVDEFKASKSLNIMYVHEPRQGIPIARNSALNARSDADDFLCFIDDDETAGENWIDEFLAVRQQFGGDCFYGPVTPRFPAQRPEWFVQSRFFAAWEHENGEQLDFAASNNVMISSKFVKEKGLQFDERMRFTGGSDYLFFRQGFESGMVIRWAERAMVFEDIPLSRMTWSWVLKRHYRIGNTFSISERILGRKAILARRFCVGVARIGLGTVMLPTVAFSPAIGMQAIGHVVRGAGMLAGLFGHQHEEYAPASLQR